MIAMKNITRLFLSSSYELSFTVSSWSINNVCANVSQGAVICRDACCAPLLLCLDCSIVGISCETCQCFLYRGSIWEWVAMRLGDLNIFCWASHLPRGSTCWIPLPYLTCLTLPRTGIAKTDTVNARYAYGSLNIIRSIIATIFLRSPWGLRSIISLFIIVEVSGITRE